MINLAQKRQLSSERSAFLDIGLASLLVMVWLTTLLAAFSIPLDHLPWIGLLVGIFIRTLSHTGLFIVTHEAIHRNISKSYLLNNFFGYLTSYLYALLPYAVLAKNHRLHHGFPGTQMDPDSAQPGNINYFTWYYKFMRAYQVDGQAWVSILGIATIFCLLLLLGVPVPNLIAFWIMPMVASSFQLFTFGIFLPHRSGHLSTANRHQASSLKLPIFWSFITCYHFGYHREHHQYPYLPWYRLPYVYLKGDA
jgi:beta-carotene ketolase (CrtW type)